MYGNPHRLGLIQDRPLDGLPYPVRRVSRKLASEPSVKVLDRLYEPDVAFGDKVLKLKPPIHAPLCYAHDKPEIRLYHPFPGILVAASYLVRDIPFFLGRKERTLPYVREIRPYGIVKSKTLGTLFLFAVFLGCFFFDKIRAHKNLRYIKLSSKTPPLRGACS